MIATPTNCEVSLTGDLDRANCLCPEPTPPQILFDNCNTALQVDLPQPDAMFEWVSMMTDYASVHNLEQLVSDARNKLEQSQLHLQTTQQAEAALQPRVSSMNAEVEQLRSRFHDLTNTDNELVRYSMEQLQSIGSLRSQLASKSSNSEPISRLLQQLLLILPTDLNNDLTPDDIISVPLLCARC